MSFLAASIPTFGTYVAAGIFLGLVAGVAIGLLAALIALEAFDIYTPTAMKIAAVAGLIAFIVITILTMMAYDRDWDKYRMFTGG